MDHEISNTAQTVLIQQVLVHVCMCVCMCIQPLAVLKGAISVKSWKGGCCFSTAVQRLMSRGTASGISDIYNLETLLVIDFCKPQVQVHPFLEVLYTK